MVELKTEAEVEAMAAAGAVVADALRAIADGDLVSIDFGATLRSWCGDAVRCFIVGTPRTEDTALIEPCTRIRTCRTKGARAGCPQIATGTDDHIHDPDGWTLRTASGVRGTQRAHRRRHPRWCPHLDQLTWLPWPN